MTQSLYELLADCTVRIVSNGIQGTGFFVAPGLILTCAHVVTNAQQEGVQKLPIKVSWKRQEYSAQIGAFRNPDYPDLALLQASIPNHPCVLLHGGADPFSDLYSYGYGDIESQGASTTFACEGWAGEKHELLKFKEGQVRPGMSGSPVMNRQTGSVCGIVQTTRDRNNALGGKAMLTKVVLHEFPELEEKQRQFHQQDRRWADALTSQQREALGTMVSIDAAHPFEIFYSYVDEDEDMALKLQKHLILLKRQKLITDWHPGKIAPGEEPSEQIKQHLDAAKIILLLISQDFMFSEYHDTVCVKRAMERNATRDAIVIPVLLRPTSDLDKAPFGKLLVIPRNRRPINRWPDRDEAFVEVAKEIREVVERLKQASPQ